jgi:HPt (histidine-containing phosphotransfer) domain-containing protein
MDSDANTEKAVSKAQREQARVELTQRYLADLPRQLQDMRRCLDQGDLATLQQQAHRVKGTSGTYGLDSIAEQFARVETLSHRDTVQAIPSLLDELTVLIAEATERYTP